MKEVMKMFRILYNGVKRHGRLIIPAGGMTCQTEEEIKEAVAKLEARGCTIFSIDKIR